VAGKYSAAFAFVGTPADIATPNVNKAQIAVPIQWLRGDLFARRRTRSYLCLEMYSLRVGNNSFNIEVLMSNRTLNDAVSRLPPPSAARILFSLIMAGVRIGQVAVRCQIL
jgi:hypothetical protein